jgi:hypothetical protein
VRSATFLGGGFDDGHIGFRPGPLPSSLILDGEPYALRRGGRSATYFAVRVWPRGRRHFDAASQEAFLSAYVSGMTVADAAQIVGFKPGVVYNARKRDPAFAAAYETAKQRKRERRKETEREMVTSLPPWRTEHA